MRCIFSYLICLCESMDQPRCILPLTNSAPNKTITQSILSLPTTVLPYPLPLIKSVSIPLHITPASNNILLFPNAFVGNFGITAKSPTKTFGDDECLIRQPDLLHFCNYLSPGFIAFSLLQKFTISFVVYFVCTRLVDAGLCSKPSPGRCSVFGRIGLGAKPPPQFGHTLFNTVATQFAQKVHSQLQIQASVDSGGKSLSHSSQLGRSCSMAYPACVRIIVAFV